MPLRNLRHEAVAVAYFKDEKRIGWRSYASVYPNVSQHAAETAWGRLLRKAEFRDRIAELISNAAREAELSVAKTLNELGHVAFANMLNYTRQHGSQLITDFSQLTREQASAIKKIKVKTTRELRGEGDDAEEVEVQTTELELVDKLRALEMIGRHFKMFVDRREVEVMGNLGDRLNEAIRREEAGD